MIQCLCVCVCFLRERECVFIVTHVDNGEMWILCIYDFIFWWVICQTSLFFDCNPKPPHLRDLSRSQSLCFFFLIFFFFFCRLHIFWPHFLCVTRWNFTEASICSAKHTALDHRGGPRSALLCLDFFKAEGYILCAKPPLHSPYVTHLGLGRSLSLNIVHY